MTQEEKQLLLKDLCARLPYGVKCHFKYGAAEDDVILGCIDNGVARFEYGWYGRFHVSIDADYIKPYLRLMSSMTEEEKKEVSILLNYEFYIDDDCALVAEDDRHRIRLDLMQVYIDWLNAHHFDYRTDEEGKTLIEKGLALEAPEGMYKS